MYRTHVLKAELLRICWGNYRRDVQLWCGGGLGTGLIATEGDSPSLHHRGGHDGPSSVRRRKGLKMSKWWSKYEDERGTEQLTSDRAAGTASRHIIDVE